MSTPTWYDVLDVDRTASTEEIRAAWKRSIEGLDPTERRFRTLSDAAAVLLDPAARTEYDAGLSPAETAAESPAETAEPVAVRVPEEADVRTLAAAGEKRTRGAGTSEVVVDEPAGAPADTATEEAPASRRRRSLFRRATPSAASTAEESTSATPVVDAPASGRSAARVPLVPARWLIGLGVLAALTGTAAGISLAHAGGPGEVTVANANDSVNTANNNQPLNHDYVTDAEPDAAAALQAAKTAVVPVLSYDYRHMAASKQKAEGYLTDAYKAQYDKLFALLEQNAPSTKTVVTTNPPVDAGITLVSPGRVEVLVFVDRPTTSKVHTTPIDYQDYVTLTMADVNGTWLVDGMATTPASS